MASSTPPTHSIHTLPSGRKLSYTIAGGPLPSPPSSSLKVIFYFHGFPGSGAEVGFFPPSFLASHNARCIGIDRPGMGESTYDHRRRVLDWPSDVLAVADHLGVWGFYVLAVSGGAPYAFACAREIPRAGSTCATATTGDDDDDDGGREQSGGRLRGIAVVAGAYPLDLGMGGMLPAVRATMLAGKWLPRAVTGAFMNWEVGSAARDRENPEVLVDMFRRGMKKRPPLEWAAFNHERVQRTVCASTRRCFMQGSAGVATDLMLYSDWGFRLGEVEGRGVRIWHGRLDRNVPVTMAERAAELMPEVSLHIVEDEGHLGLPVNRGEEIVLDLLNDVE